MPTTTHSGRVTNLAFLRPTEMGMFPYGVVSGRKVATMVTVVVASQAGVVG
jgi:hypothetical protein